MFDLTYILVKRIGFKPQEISPLRILRGLLCVVTLTSQEIYGALTQHAIKQVLGDADLLLHHNLDLGR